MLFFILIFRGSLLTAVPTQLRSGIVDTTVTRSDSLTGVVVSIPDVSQEQSLAIVVDCVPVNSGE